MNETAVLLRAGGLGFLLGTLFFAGLWWTVRKGLSSKRPALWFGVSLLVRTGLVVAGFHLAAGGRRERLLACLLGFVAARFVVTLRLRLPALLQAPERPAGRGPNTYPPAEPPMDPAREARHAP